MIFKEAIAESDEDERVSTGQIMRYRSLKKYMNIFRTCGYSIPLTQKHDRSKDCGSGKLGYDDEVLFCVQPIILSCANTNGKL